MKGVIVGFATTHVGHSSLFTLCDPWFSQQKGAKFLVAMVVHVTCSCACMGYEHKPPNCHEASLLVACLLAITLGPGTDHCADSDSVHNGQQSRTKLQTNSLSFVCSFLASSIKACRRNKLKCEGKNEPCWKPY